VTLITDNASSTRARFEPALALYPLAHLAVEVYNGMAAVMWPLFLTRFGLGFGSLGLLTMVFRVSMALPQIGFAALADRIGSRTIAIWGLLCMAIGMSMTGLAPTVGILVILLALAPLGSAAFHPAGTAHMSRAMPYRRATAVALFMIGGTVGMSIGTLLGAQVYGRYGLTASPIFLPLGLIVALLMFLMIGADRPLAQQRHAAAGPAPAIPRAIYFLMGVAIIQAWIETGLQSYLTTLLTGRGESLVTASQVLFAYAAAAAGGIFLGGALSDRVPRWRVIILSQALCAPFYAAVLLLNGPVLLLVSGALGFVVSLAFPVTVALAQELMPERTSLASALTMGVSWVIGSIGVVITGVLADRIGLGNALMLNCCLPLLGMACILVVRRLGVQTPAPAPIDSDRSVVV
jgi:MFS transporter, FSR family, fosmidomycin resistance protein